MTPVVEPTANVGDHSFFPDFCQIAFLNLQVACRDPRKTSAGRADRIPIARFMAVDFNLLASVQQIGRVVVLGGTAPDRGFVVNDSGREGEVLPGGYNRGLTETEQQQKSSSHGKRYFGAFVFQKATSGRKQQGCL